MDLFYGDYKPNFIFRNQPHYTYYSDSIKETDPLYLCIHDIDRYFLCHEYKLPYKNMPIKDPRTNKEIEQLIYDHSKEMKAPIFNSVSKQSFISYWNHVLGVKIIKQLQESAPLAEDESTTWYLLEQKRSKENEAFQKYVYDCCAGNKYQIVSRVEHLTDLYKQWYYKQCEIFKTRYNSDTYNIFGSMPHPKAYELPLKENDFAEIQNIEVLKREGYVLSLKDNKKLNFQSLKYNINTCHEEYINGLQSKEECIAQLKTNFLNGVEKGAPIFYIPLDSLMFLLISGDYSDTPTEMLLKIESNEMSQTIIIMEKPLPACSFGWHTNKKVIEQSAVSLLSLQDNQLWFKLHNNQVYEDLQTIPEIKGNEIGNNLYSYKLTTVEDYMSTYVNKLTKTERCRGLNILTKWNLKIPNANSGLIIYTPMDYLAAISDNNSSSNETCPSNSLNIISLKMEYKSLYGCEIMTKYELLKEWFHLKLSKTFPTIHYRLDINNYETLAKEILTCERLEGQLLNLYKVNIAHLLSGLEHYLKILLQMPCGQYMVCYKSKSPEKFLLRQRSEDTSQNTIYLHHLLQSKLPNVVFAWNAEYLPIAPDVCGRIHLENNQLPCTFRHYYGRNPRTKKQKQQCKARQKNSAEKVIHKSFNDRKCILKKIQLSKIIKEKIKSHKRILVKKRKRQQRKKLKNKIATEKQNEEESLQKEIMRDQLFFGG